MSARDEDEGFTYEKTEVHTWSLQIWDDPMPFSKLRDLVQDASNFALIPRAKAEWSFHEPDMIEVRIEIPAED